MDPKNISLVYFNIPFINLICVIKELIVGIINPLHILLAFGWGIVYIVIAIAFARHMFNKESVVFRV
jgi:sodium transport system permease protein